MEFRKVFDTIPEQFDKYRPRYSKELFDVLKEKAGIGPGSKVLEIGPGTGQATEPILATGCDYLAIELGENLYEKMKQKYGSFANFRIINDDFITHDFGSQQFDMIYSAASIQWIPQDIAFTKTYDLLRNGGVLAMMYTDPEYKTSNEELYDRIQLVYDKYFKPEVKYRPGTFKYEDAPGYGYTDLERYKFRGKRILTAEQYVAYCGTHSDHITIPEPYKTLFFDELKNAVLDAGNRIEFNDTYILYLARKIRKKSMRFCTYLNEVIH